MTTAQLHWQQELNLVMNAIDERAAKGKNPSKKQLARVRFVAACIQAHEAN